MVSQSTPRPLILVVASIVAAIALALLFWLDLHLGVKFNASTVYPVVLLACWWARSRRLLWGLFATSILLAFTANQFEDDQRAAMHRFLLCVGLLVETFIFDHLLRSWSESLLRAETLEANNAEIAAREEEIARQNEELQSQTEELERQSEELSVTNEELARRERSLGVLLELSRNLSIEMPVDEALSRICETLNILLDGSGTASAVLLREGDTIRVACHHGFGPEGIRAETFPFDSTFASLVLSHGRTGFIEDISLRPDLQIPQPVNVAPMVTVISAPLQVGGKLIGAIEGYSTHRRSWSPEQIALIESIASQTASTLRADSLFGEVAQERRKFEALFRTAPVAMAFIEAGSSTLRFNPAGAVMMGMPADTDVEHADFVKQVRVFRGGVEQNSLPTALPLTTNQETIAQEADVVLPSGRRITILYSVAPIRNAEGEPIASVSASVDITPLKDLQRELDVRRREAEEASVRKTRFLAAVSHDVRTPANAISLLAELIRRTASLPGRESEIAEMAKELHSSAMALVSLLGDVLDVTRFDAGRIELQESEFDLRDLLQMECKHLMPLARDKNLNFTFEEGADLWVHSDKIKLARVIGNLIGNAIKFTEHGEVRVTYGFEPGSNDDPRRVRIAVTDTGVGIAPENLSYIFDEFFQLRNPERDRNKGNGLGLTICKRLADAMGAELDVKSASGKGSTFSVYLPATVVIAPRV